MPRAAPSSKLVLSDALLSAFEINDRNNVSMIENLPANAWRGKPPDGKGRVIAAKGSPIPEQLDHHQLTPAQAKSRLAQSRVALSVILKRALEGNGRVKGFGPDVAAFFGYLVAHDAHHRGQIAMLARQLGHPLPQEAMVGMWEWGTR
jgi:hypothetical protein